MRILATAHRALFAAVAMAGLAAVPAISLAQTGQKSAGGIYSCIDANGKKLTSDRPIAECAGRDQRLLNSDGSVREVVPPVPTADERAAIEARQQEEALARAVQREAIRRDRNLLARFPNEAAHNKARESALEDTRTALRLSESRLAGLEKERKPLHGRVGVLRRQAVAAQAQAADRRQRGERPRRSATWCRTRRPSWCASTTATTRNWCVCASSGRAPSRARWARCLPPSRPPPRARRSGSK